MLCLKYDLWRDAIIFKLKLNFYQNIRGKKVSTTLTMDKMRQIWNGTKSPSRRATLSILQGWFDPMGLLSPALLKGKQLLCRLHNPSQGRDDKIPVEERPCLEVAGRDPQFGGDLLPALHHTARAQGRALPGRLCRLNLEPTVQLSMCSGRLRGPCLFLPPHS